MFPIELLGVLVDGLFIPLMITLYKSNISDNENFHPVIVFLLYALIGVT